ncbi:hypothetical protein HanPSC8_Chr08g0314101 [Helianthus annuus]|nr:hypothetical protein HanPSC8_Chr08g0314101 [Helianthus annuus]
MVFSGKKRGGEERDTSEKEDMERLKPLHNFDLPYLKWGNQKHLRCMKIDSLVDRNQSPERGGGGGGDFGGGAVIGTQRRDSEFKKRKRFRSSGDIHKVSSSSEKVTARINVAGDGEISATREKLMIDFHKQVGEIKDAILRDGLVDATATTSFNSPADRPWNLRTRRAPTNGVNGNGEVLKPNSFPVTNEYKYPSNNGNGEKKERAKFSVSLSRRELEEDFMAMAGRRLPRKPKKRPRFVQKQLDTLFPGLWLSEITADLYKVPDEAETGKR